MSTDRLTVTQSTDPSRLPVVPPQSQIGAGPVGVLGILALAFYLVALAVLLIGGLAKLWPQPAPSSGAGPGVTARLAEPPPQLTLAASSSSTAAPPGPTGGVAPAPLHAAPDANQITFLLWGLQDSYEVRLFLIVVLAGALGSLVHALRSLYWYVGNRALVWSWGLQYLLLPFVGATLGVVFYLVARGGLVPQPITSSNAPISPFGFAAVSSLAGLFSHQAIERLKLVATTLLAEAPKGKDDVPPKKTEPDVQVSVAEAATAPKQVDVSVSDQQSSVAISPADAPTEEPAPEDAVAGDAPPQREESPSGKGDQH
jgi:hypothetical protein